MCSPGPVIYQFGILEPYFWTLQVVTTNTCKTCHGKLIFSILELWLQIWAKQNPEDAFLAYLNLDLRRAKSKGSILTGLVWFVATQKKGKKLRTDLGKRVKTAFKERRSPRNVKAAPRSGKKEQLRKKQILLQFGRDGTLLETQF